MSTAHAIKRRKDADPIIWVPVVFLVCLQGVGGCTYMQTRSPGDRISCEEKVGRQFALEASSYFRWMDEPEVLDFVKDIGHRLSAHVAGSPYEYDFYVVRDPTMNAFAVPGGYICFFAGLIAQADTVDGLAGVMAHEISHVEGNHFIRGQQKMDVANTASLAATILAAALGGGQGGSRRRNPGPGRAADRSPRLQPPIRTGGGPRGRQIGPGGGIRPERDGVHFKAVPRPGAPERCGSSALLPYPPPT